MSKDEKLSKKDEEFLASLNKEVVFTHKHKDLFKALGVRERDVKKFMIDLTEDAGDKVSEALEFIWKSSNPIEFKIVTFFFFGRELGRQEGKMMGGDGMPDFGRILGIIKKHIEDNSD